MVRCEAGIDQHELSRLGIVVTSLPHAEESAGSTARIAIVRTLAGTIPAESLRIFDRHPDAALAVEHRIMRIRRMLGTPKVLVAPEV